MKRPPLLPTLLVLAAMAVMVSLGMWQLRRAAWKEALIADYAKASTLPPIAFPTPPDPKHLPLFRKAAAYCLSVTAWRSVAGRNVAGESGWSHIAECSTGAEGPGFAADMGWSRDLANPAWKGGDVSGVIGADKPHLYRLVATTPAPGLSASAPPSMDEIPNNHMSYAVQWFIFAGLAGVIYAIALRRRVR